MKFLEFLDLQEGVNDPAIFKVVFLAGGPGSGKSFIVGKTGLSSLGFTVINSDAPFEYLMKKLGLDMKMPESEKEQRDVARDRAKATANAKIDLSIQGRLGMVIDGTGKDYDKIMKMRGKLAVKGYDSAMIFVNTNQETALARNAKRERSVPDSVAKKGWSDVQQNLGKFQQSFGSKMFIIDNSEGSDYVTQTNFVYKQISKWVKEKPKNGVAVKWINDQKKARNITESECDLVKQKELSDLEKFADRLLSKFDIDVEFTKHFGDRVSDGRNDPCIKIAELQQLFKKIAKDKAAKVLQHKDSEAVLKDIQSDLNLPFILKAKGDEFELVAKTIMRKKDFKSPDPEVKYESYKPSISFTQFISEEKKKEKKEKLKDEGNTKIEINPTIE